MATTAGASEGSAPFLGMPLEIHTKILEQLDTVESLSSAVLSCRRLHDAYKVAPSSIATEVLINHFDEDTLPEAIAALEASKMQAPLTPADYYDFVARHFTERAIEIEFSVKGIAEAAAFVKLQGVVFRFSAKLMDVGQTFYFPTTKLPFTATEKARTRQAFYRVEIFICLFRRSPASNYGTNNVTDTWARMNEFWRRFSPWENEQLACVQDFLFRATKASKSIPSWMSLTGYSFDTDDIHQLSMKLLNTMCCGEPCEVWAF